MTNVADSVRARLMNVFRATGVDLPTLIERFAIGRLLWRLSQSQSDRQFVLKGAQVFSVWQSSPHRPTRDLDVLSFGDPSLAEVKLFFDELLAKPADPEDGLVWAEAKVSLIREDQEYQGVRVALKAVLAKAVVPVQIDIGFGDAITPSPVELEWRELLDFPAARLLTYPPETVIAEKLNAACELGVGNSRMKDFFDLDWLCRHMEFDQSTLHAAVTATFAKRGTDLPTEPPLALTQAFAVEQSKLTQWSAFLRKNQLSADPLAVVIARLADFLLPVLFPPAPASVRRWKPHVGWQSVA
jgi:hypothetical protein